MDNTWFKFYRKAEDSQVFDNEGLWKLWTWCLMKASYMERWVSVDVGQGSTEVKLESGQFIFGRYSAAKKLKMKPSTLHKRLNKLEKMGNLNIQSGSHYSIVSICNWEKYQGNNLEKEQPKEPPGNHGGTTGEHKQESNKVKTVKKSIPLIPFGGDGQWEKFWTAYPKRKSKQDAIKAWNQLEPDDGLLQIMLAAIQTQRETEQWQKESGAFIPFPGTWIRGRLWEDETGEIIGEDDNEQKWSAEDGRYLPSKRKLREQREGR